jgi:hypothetical protein
MKKLPVVALVLAGTLVILISSTLSSRKEAEAFRVERESLRREMVDRSLVARGLAGPQGAEEAKAVVRWWLDGVTALRNRFPGPAKEADAKMAPLGSDAEGEGWKKYVADRLDTVRAGYAPVLSAVDQGMRLDILSMKVGENPDSRERGLRIDFALWGAPRRLDADSSNVPGVRNTLHVVVPVAFRQLSFHFVSSAGKAYGEMSGTGEPYRMLKDPERFSPELPPGVVFGTWWVEPFPREAARVEMSVGVQVQGQTAGALSPTFHWEMPVAEDWKLLPGQTFRAEVREVDPASMK